MAALCHQTLGRQTLGRQALGHQALGHQSERVMAPRRSPAQPLRLPAVRPDRILRWKTRKNTSVGTAAIAEAASTRFCGVVLAASKIPTFSVSRFGLYPYSTSSGQRKSFQTATSPKIETTPMIGREIGSTTERR